MNKLIILAVMLTPFAIADEIKFGFKIHRLVESVQVPTI